MNPDQKRPLLFPSRGVVLFEHFCRSTGLDEGTVACLMREGRVEGALWTDREPTRPYGIFDDVLPSRETLVGMGLSVRDDYDPEVLRSFETPDFDSGP